MLCNAHLSLNVASDSCVGKYFLHFLGTPHTYIPTFIKSSIRPRDVK